jgi:histidinol-phosphate aminotransferase
MVLMRCSASADDGGDTAQALFAALKARGVLIKNVSKMHPLLAGCVRLTVGTADENARLIQALQEILC